MAISTKSLQRNGKPEEIAPRFEDYTVAISKRVIFVILSVTALFISNLKNSLIVILVIFKKLDDTDNKGFIDSNILNGKKRCNLVRFSCNPVIFAVILAKKGAAGIIPHPLFSGVLRNLFILKHLYGFSSKTAALQAYSAAFYGNIY